MTVIQPIEKDIDLGNTYEKILQAIETEDYNQALALTQKGKKAAEHNGHEEWTNQFEELRLQIEIALHVDDLNDKFDINEIQDFTVLKGIGPSAAKKLTNAGFVSIQQLARSNPQEVTAIKGFGLATAKILVEDAKSYLQLHIRSEDKALETWKPALSIEKNNTKKEPLEQEDRSSINLLSDQPTPYQQLLEREPLELKSMIDREEMKNVKEEVIEKSEEEEEEDEDLLHNLDKLKPWFDTLYQYSRLTGVHPPKSKSKIQDTAFIEPLLMYEDYKKQEEQEDRENSFQTQIKNNTCDKESYSSLVEDSSNKAPNTAKSDIEPITSEFIEPERVINPPFNPPSIKEPIIPSLAQTKHAPQMNLTNEIKNYLREQGYRLIPNHRFHIINHLAYKIIPLDGNIKLVLLLPIRIEEYERMLIVSENMVRSQTDSNSEIHSIQELLDCRDCIFNDIISEGDFFQFLNKYLKLHLTIEKSVEQKRLYLISEQDQYKVFIEPILLSKSTPHFMEKFVPFAYQRNTNLHVVHYEVLPDLLDFLESKYEILETHAHGKTAIQQYQDASGSFNHKLRLASFLMLGYTLLLFIMFITHWFYILRIFLNIGYAVMGIYILTMVYTYYRFYLVKKILAGQFNTPYYQLQIHLEEADLLVLQEEYSNEVLLQFGYECFEKPTSDTILKDFDSYSTENSLGQSQKELANRNQQLELLSNNQELLEKYRSFLED